MRGVLPGATARLLGRMVRLACRGRHRASFMRGLYPIPRKGI
jgi:hypothetical protein